jgi:hypothetical protein
MSKTRVRVRRTGQEIFDNVIDFLRKSVHKMNDSRLSVRLAAVIASCTKEKTDIGLAISLASEHDSRSLQAEMMAVVAKTLSEGLHLDEARGIAHDMEMKGLDRYWIAEAWIWIARFSVQKTDEEKAEEAISRINTPALRNEAREDLKLLLRRHQHTGIQKDKKHLSDLQTLRAVLSKLKVMEDSHVISPKFTSVHLRFVADGIIGMIFADAMK